MRTIAKGWALLTAMCSMMLAATVVNAQAPYQEPIGTESGVTATGEITVKLPDGKFYTIPYEGAGTFETVGNDGVEEEEGKFRASTQLVPVSLGGAGNIEGASDFVWQADLTRATDHTLISTITANQLDNDFPATGILEFQAQITLSADPDVVYLSESPIKLVNRLIASWPYRDTRYQLDKAVTFVRADDPQKTILVTDMDIKLNPVVTPGGPCADICCKTDVLSLNTGYNHAAGSTYTFGSSDNYWTIVSDPAPRPTPRYATVIPKISVWANPLPNTQWIGPNATALDPHLVPVTYQKCFCLCQTSTLTFNLSILVDDQASVYVDGNLIGSTPNLAFTTPTNITFTRALLAGRHCVEVVVTNKQLSHSGLNIQGSVHGPGLLKYNCCGPQPIPPSACYTNRLKLGTNSSWTLLSGPPNSGNYPRCASIIPKPSPTWGPAIPGTSWIGPNSTGKSAPGPNNTYIYRKCFCVAQTGTYILTFTTMADDMVDVYLNTTVLLYSHAGYKIPSTRTFIVALTAGCNCLDFRVKDQGYVITGLDVLIDIQGGLLFQEACCSCSSCNTPSFPPDNLPPSKLSMNGGQGSEAEARMVADVAGIDATARPMLVNIPDPTSGENFVHYVMDKNAQAQVELYNATGELVRVVDEGARESGQHVVPLATDGLPSGSYVLQLVYAEHTLAVPVEVQ